MSVFQLFVNKDTLHLKRRTQLSRAFLPVLQPDLSRRLRKHMINQPNPNLLSGSTGRSVHTCQVFGGNFSAFG